MKRWALLGGAAVSVVFASGLALAQGKPESILPPGFEDPAPAARPTPRPTPAPRAAPKTAEPASDRLAAAPSAAPTTAVPVVQAVPGSGSSAGGAADGTRTASPGLPTIGGNLPTLDQLERMSTDELDELLGLKPKVDIPPAARRAMSEVGAIGPGEGGLPTQSLANQPTALVRAALAGTRQPLVSRWGHILVRRALASRLTAPRGMDPAEFAGLRIAALNAIGEFAVARAVAQDVDTANWNPLLTNGAIDAYLGTGDVIGACPAVTLQGTAREDGTWRLLQGICSAYAGEGARAKTDLRRVASRGQAAPFDSLLAQRLAGAAGTGRGAVTIEWGGVKELTPLRFALARAVGENVPASLLDGATPYYSYASAISPMVPLPARMGPASVAAQQGILSSQALVDLYSQFATEVGGNSPDAAIATSLRQAYIGGTPAARLAAIRDVWGAGENGTKAIDYGRQVLTAYAAARLDPLPDFADDAGPLIAAMLSAGLERDALRWVGIVKEGSAGWAQLVFANPAQRGEISSGAVSTFEGDDDSPDKRRTQFLVAGLAGLGRMAESDVQGLSSDLRMNLGGATRWTRAIDSAAAVDNQALVVMLAGLGMQGSGWDRMTARHLFHIVSALNKVGLNAEARMIAAEAVARG